MATKGETMQADAKRREAELRRSNQEAAGIPDSRPFVAEEADRVPSGVDRILACHINGVPIKDLNLDPSVLCALDFFATDEGQAEKLANPNLREASGVTVGAGSFEKALQQKRDDVKERNMPVYEARDPFREMAARYVKAGMRPKMMAANRVNDGVNCDYEVVKDEKGDPVKVQGMVLGQIPEQRAQLIVKHFAEQGNRILKQIGEQYKKDGGITAVADQ